MGVVVVQAHAGANVGCGRADSVYCLYFAHRLVVGFNGFPPVYLNGVCNSVRGCLAPMPIESTSSRLEILETLTTPVSPSL